MYTWFLGTYNVSVGVGILGYALLVGELFLASSGASRGGSGSRGSAGEGGGGPPGGPRVQGRGRGCAVVWALFWRAGPGRRGGRRGPHGPYFPCPPNTCMVDST